MKNFFALFLVLSIFFIACEKKDVTTDVKKEVQKTEQKQETQTTTTQLGDFKLPADFPIEDENFKKAAISSVSESMGLVTITFKPEGIPEDITAVVEKELTKKGFKKDKEEKIGDTMTEFEWSAGAKKIGMDITTAGGKRTMVAVFYEKGK